MIQLEGQKIAVFDLEIKKPIESLTDGWRSHNEMGVSCLVLFDYEAMRYRVFDDQNIAEAIAILWTYDWVVGFNTVGFDWKVVKATYPNDIPMSPRQSRDFDILREIWKSLGVDPDNFKPATHGGYKLDDVAFDTVMMRKTGNGAEAPLLFEKGRWAELLDYCIEDVRIERTLFEFVVRHGYCIRNGRVINVTFNPHQKEKV